MNRVPLCLWLILYAACARSISPAIDVEVQEGAPQPWVLLTCRVPAARSHTKVVWTFPDKIQPIRRDLPLDEVTAWVERRGDGLVTCDATADGKSWKAQRYLGEIKLVSAEEKGGKLTLTTDKLPARAPDDGVFLAQGRKLVRLDLACAGAEWTDKRIVACVPSSVAKGEYAVRLQASGVLSFLPGTLKLGRP